MINKSFYDILEVSPDATQEEIKESYRLIVSMLHPDKFAKDSKQWVRATEKIQKVVEAYQTLKDVQKRAQYDRELLPEDPIVLPKQSQSSTSRTNQPVPSPRPSQPSPPPIAPRPEASVQSTQQNNRGEGCGRWIFGFLGAGCFIAIFVNLALGYIDEFGIWNDIFLTAMGLGFLLAAFFR